MKRIIIAAGGSGGHIFPAIALGRSLAMLDKDVRITYVGSDRALDRRIFEKEGKHFEVLSANKLPYEISPSGIIAAFLFIVDMFKALSIIFSYKPNVAVGFGGYVAFPLIIAASLAGVPTIVHEQNVMPGRANRLLFKIARKAALSFDETKNVIGSCAVKSIVTGNPIRNDILKAGESRMSRRFGLDESKFTVLVIGGSQGAAFLNKTFICAISTLDLKSRHMMQVIHITGVKDYERSLSSYDGLGVDYRVHSFVDRIEEAYSAADLVVTRSGSSVIFELAALRKPMVLIPYPFAMSHQLDNARAFSKNGAAILIEEKDLTAEVLASAIQGLMDDADRRRGLGEAAIIMARPDAAGKLAKIALDRT